MWEIIPTIILICRKFQIQPPFRRKLPAWRKSIRKLQDLRCKNFTVLLREKYSESNLKMAQELGYQTVFWSLAYVDWYVDQQPTQEEAYAKLLPRIHPGAVVLLHSTSKTNAEILDDLLTKWEQEGYTFGTLNELCG